MLHIGIYINYEQDLEDMFEADGGYEFFEFEGKRWPVEGHSVNDEPDGT